MDRVFQHYEGIVEALIGARFSTVKCMVDSEDSDVVLVWFQDEKSSSWYRIFIDGVYCGIDRYSNDLSSDDLDDDIQCVDNSEWFAGKTVNNAIVKSSSDSKEIVFSMSFGSEECRLVSKNEGDSCEFVYG